MLDVETYKQKIENEKKHYSMLLDQQDKNSKMIQKIEPKVNAFDYAYKQYNEYISSKFSHHDFILYILERIQSENKKLNILSLGAGTADWEIDLMTRAPTKIRCEVFDINEELLENAKKHATANGLDFHTFIQDVNKINLSESTYDFIIARSSLHHFVELEHIFSEINKSLKKNGEFLVIGEVIGRNGLQLYKETEEIAQKIFELLPDKFRYNHYTKVVDEKVPNIDHSIGSFEAIRSEEILPLIMKSFNVKEFVTNDAFLSLLLDFRYGPNYDLSLNLDKAMVDFIVNLDIHYISNEILKPTCLFGIFSRKENERQLLNSLIVM